MTSNKDLYHFITQEAVGHLLSEGNFSSLAKFPTRQIYAETIIEAAKSNEKIVVLDADVSRTIGTSKFGEIYPDRHFHFGIAEQNMAAAAAGMAASGIIPFISSFAIFLTTRSLDQIRNSIHYPKLNVKIAASHGGITPGTDGVTHQAQEDIAIMRTIANATVLAPSDAVVARKVVLAAIQYDGPVYMSFTREAVPSIFDESYPFEIGKNVVVRDGDDATIIATRDMTNKALIAAESLSKEGYEVRVLDCPSIKPFDKESVIKAAYETKAVVTIESGTVNGGLGSAVAEVLSENEPTILKRLGVQDIFTESAPYDDLLKKYGMAPEDISRAIKELIQKKHKK